MSLNVYLMVTKPVEVYDANITHNLNIMAAKCIVAPNLSLYNVLWRPDEHELVYARDIIEHLTNGLDDLISNPEFYKQFNPENGWGSYDGLVKFVDDYLNACIENPAATLEVSR